MSKSNNPLQNKTSLFPGWKCSWQRAMLFLIGIVAVTQGKSQMDKRLVMADKYFAAGDYFTAAGLYGQFLHSAGTTRYQSEFPLNVRRNGAGRSGNYKNKKVILFKEAESYRLANFWSEASALYDECFEKDSTRFPAALYWRAVCERCLGHYPAAEECLNRFFNKFNSANEWYKLALEEQQTLLYVKAQLARPDSVMYHVSKIQTDF